MRLRQAGIAALEAAAVLLVLLPILLTGWGAVDLFHRGMSLEAIVKSRFYDGAIGQYRLIEDGRRGDIEINQEGLARYLQQKVDSIGNELLAQTGSADSFFVQGAMIDVIWREHEPPRIDGLSLSRVSGLLTGKGGPETSLAQLAHRFVNEMGSSESRRIGFVRPPFFGESRPAESLLYNRFVLVGISAATVVEGGPARLLLEGISGRSRVERSSFSVVRKDL